MIAALMGCGLYLPTLLAQLLNLQGFLDDSFDRSLESRGQNA